MSSGSGIKISDEIKELYNSIHKTNSNPHYKYAVLKFNKNCSGLEIESKVVDGEAKKYNDVIAELPTDDVRYVFFDFDYITKSDAQSKKVLCLSWHPQSSPVKRRMIVASTFSALKAALSIGANESLEGDDASDLDIDTVLKKIGGKAEA